MSRTTDEQIAEWRDGHCIYHPSWRNTVLDALEAERARADAAAESNAGWRETLNGQHRFMLAEREKFQSELAEARAVAAWFAAERDWRFQELKDAQHRIRNQRGVLHSHESGWQESFRKEQLDRAHARADTAEAAIARVLALHQPVEIGDIGQCCERCSADTYPQSFPCPTVQAALEQRRTIRPT